MRIEVKISECADVGCGMVTFGFVFWGEVSGRKRTCTEVCGKGIDEASVVDGMDELLSVVSRRVSEGTNLLEAVPVEVAPESLGSSTKVSRLYLEFLNFLVILLECFLEIFLFFFLEVASEAARIAYA